MKEYWQKFKEFRKDPKKKSISLLIIYGIFFIFVFIYIKSGKSVNKPSEYTEINQNTSIYINDVTNYEYTYEIIQNNLNFKVKGIYYNNENKIELDSNYNIKDNNIYITEEFQIRFDILNNKLNYNSIKKFIDKFEYESKTEYKDNTIKYVYNIGNKDLKEYLNEDIQDEGNSIITIYENNYIYKVEFDLSTLYKQDKYLINIEYSNINNISNVETKEDVNNINNN